MKKRFLLSAGILLFSLVMPITAYAIDGSSGTEDAADSTQSSDSTNTDDDSSEAEGIRDVAKEHAANTHKKKDVRIAEIKQKVAERKAQLLKDKCEAREAKLKKLQPKIKKSADTIKNVIDRKYDRVLDFYESGKLTTADYDTLVEAIELAKANAETSMEALTAYEFEVDCDSSSAAEDLGAYREAVNEVKQDLKDYRKSLVALISSLKSAAAQKDATTDSAHGTGTEGTEGETENE